MEHLSAPQRVLATLRAAGLETEVREFAESTRTAQDAAAAIGTTVAQIVKSLVFLSGDRPVLALVSGSNQLDPAKLGRLTGGEVRKADAASVRGATGYVIGGVPPAGFPGPIDTYIDRDLLRYDELWAAAGTPHHVFRTTPKDLIRLTGGATADLSAQT
ncbi:MAG TPA: YbaK/EbsC family protein [Candidatus Dormibacteraeota bacterium]